MHDRAVAHDTYRPSSGRWLSFEFQRLPSQTREISCVWSPIARQVPEATQDTDSSGTVKAELGRGETL